MNSGSAVRVSLTIDVSRKLSSLSSENCAWKNGDDDMNFPATAETEDTP